MNPGHRIFVALDTPDEARARELISTLSGVVGGFKIGLELYSSVGPRIVEHARAIGVPVFLDLKFHDIPDTVGGAVASATRLGASYLTVHGTGGLAMIREAVTRAAAVAEQRGRTPPVILAVTVLTSHDDDDLVRIGLAGPCRSAVLRLARIALDAGAGGVVCSPLEVAAVREIFPDGCLVVPGVRPAGSARDDQSRVATPSSAVAAGADRLVIGRPITRADDPVQAALAIAMEIEAGTSDSRGSHAPPR